MQLAIAIGTIGDKLNSLVVSIAIDSIVIDTIADGNPIVVEWCEPPNGAGPEVLKVEFSTVASY